MINNDSITYEAVIISQFNFTFFCALSCHIEISFVLCL